jgi:hypothetical protein
MMLPTKEQIEAISNVAALQALESDIDATLTKIETDLEFAPGDDEWHARARGAYTAHSIALKRIRRHMAFLRHQASPKQVAEQNKFAKKERKLDNKEIAALHLERSNEASRLKLARTESNRLDLAHSRLAKTVGDVSLGVSFMLVCRQHLDSATFDKILSLAGETVAASVVRVLEPVAHLAAAGGKG